MPQCALIYGQLSFHLVWLSEDRVHSAFRVVVVAFCMNRYSHYPTWKLAFESQCPLTAVFMVRLLVLKERYKEANGGVPFDPPSTEGKKKKKDKGGEDKAEPERTGPSKGVRT
jgi:hypothetical protein